VRVFTVIDEADAADAAPDDELPGDVVCEALVQAVAIRAAAPIGAATAARVSFRERARMMSSFCIGEASRDDH
jgi:hypothetical protein